MNLKSLLKALKLNESTISMILGAIVIVVVGVLVINYFKSTDEGITIPPVDTEDLSLPTTHVVSEGEELWGISEKYYGTGYEWQKIAGQNNLNPPYTIEVGQKLTIPAIEKGLASNETTDQLPTITIEIEEEKEVETQVGADTYTIEKGDTLWSISEKVYGSGYEWTTLAKDNNINPPYNIEVGQVLSISKTGKGGAESSYTVQSGDYLWKIALEVYGDGYRWIDIAKANELDNPNVIHPGNILTLPR